ncbi:SET domain-containing protein [Fomitopsis serialis]|uniref:SET domain-containing protein n=1 Tax=Fomitopsis serialis TaxID=139415 RepID=UPI002008BB6A|nr:SET domain-containing protein [Neoantrodia serialis]KAH9922237.1 SET domain-containing protein [Neoantrodia serialis]
MSQSSISPAEDDLKAALHALRVGHPSLGAAKLHAQLLAHHPHWTVSEKRTRKILQQEGLILSCVTAQNHGAGQPGLNGASDHLPSSHLVENLDVRKWTPKVEVRYFGRKKGKGLVASEDIAEGEAIWKEEPFVLAPEWEIYDLQVAGVACAFCSTPLTQSSSLVLPCSSSSASTPSTPSCPARFCNRLCLSRSARTHPLLCPANNPASQGLIKFARQSEWMALHALAQCTARVILAYQQDETQAETDWRFVKAMAQLGMEQRAKGGWLNGAEPDRETWKKAFEHYVRAFREPATDREKKRLARTLKKPVKPEIADALFTYDAFLLGLGRMSLNLEAHGGLYVLHSHLNHSCEPSLSVRHLDQRTALARVTVLARRAIPAGEELTITYVDPSLPVEQRRKRLLEWGFGKCECERCVREAKAVEERRATAGAEGGDGVDGAANGEMSDLEAELKAGLGVL